MCAQLREKDVFTVERCVNGDSSSVEETSEVGSGPCSTTLIGVLQEGRNEKNLDFSF